MKTRISPLVWGCAVTMTMTTTAGCGSDSAGTDTSDAALDGAAPSDGTGTVDGDAGGEPDGGEPDSVGEPDAGDVGPADPDAGPMDADTNVPEDAITDLDAPDADAGEADGADVELPPDAAEADVSEDTGVDAESGDTGDDDAGTDAVTEDTVGPDVGLPLAVRTVALDQEGYCPGDEVTVEFELNETPVEPVLVQAELSDEFGRFFFPTVVATVETRTSGSLTFDLPADDSVSTQSRVRVVFDGASAVESGLPLGLLPSPEIDVFFFNSFATVRTNHSVSNDTTGVVSQLWEFGEDAVPPTSTAVEPNWTYSTTGFKTVTFTATGSNGCQRQEVFTNAIDVLGCERMIAPDTAVLRGSGGLDGRGENWVCDGANRSDGGGRRLALVEPGGAFNYDGGGSYGAMIRAGGRFTGNDRIALVYETGAILGTVPSTAVECPTMVFDPTNAGEDRCTAAGAGPVVSSVSVTGGVFCVGAERSVGFNTSPAPQTGNRYEVQLSSATGEFFDARVIGSLESSAASGSIPVTIPADVDVNGSYRVRVVTSNPPSIGPAFGPISLSSLAAPQFAPSRNPVFADTDVTFNLTAATTATSYAWDFGEGATPRTSTDAAPTVRWSTAGPKRVSLTVTGSDGCSVTTATETMRVLGCSATVPSDAQVVTTSGGDLFNPNGSIYVCPGAQTRVFGNASPDVFVAEGGSLDWSAISGTGRIYMDRNSLLVGPSVRASGHSVIHESSTLLSRLGEMQTFLCPDVAIDASAVAARCPPFSPVEPGLNVQPIASSTVCADTEIDVTFSEVGLASPDSVYEIELSNESGDFAAPVQLRRVFDAGTYTVRIPAATPPGNSYRIRVRGSAPVVSQLSPTTLLVPPRPAVSFTAQPTVSLAGTAISITNTSSGAVSWEWDFGDGASPASSTSANPGTITYATEGIRDIRLTGTNAELCAASATAVGIRTLSCNPTIPSSAQAISGTGSGSGGSAQIRVCDGGAYSAGGGSYTIYVEPGGTYTRTGGGTYFVYVPAGANYVASTGGITYLVAAPGANITGNASTHVRFDCDSITFDASAAPSCP